MPLPTPAQYPDTVLVGSRVTTIGNSSFRMEHRIVSRALREVVAEADSAMVTVDYSTGKSQRVPDDVRQAIAQLEKSRGADLSAEQSADI